MKTTKESKPTDKVLRDALAKIKMPPPLSGDIARISRELSPKSGGKFDPARVQAILNEIVSNKDPSQRFLDWKVAHPLLNQPSLIEILAGLYVPTMDTPPLGLSDHLYWWNQTESASSPSSAAASITTGKLICSAVLNADNFNASPVAPTATIFIQVDTSQPGYGPANLLTFAPEILWQAAIAGTGDSSDWGRNIAGTLQVAGFVHLSASRANQGQWESVQSSSPIQLFPQVTGQRAIDSANQNFSGAFKPPSLQLQFNAYDGATYALGVWVSIQITNNFANTSVGKALPPVPKGSDFAWSGTITATIPYMQVTHVVL
jgi:hypothetical protein